MADISDHSPACDGSTDGRLVKTLAQLIFRRRYSILAGIALITLFLGYFSLRIQINQKPEELILKDDPEYPVLKSFSKDFGYDEIIVAAYSADNVLARDILEVIQAITLQLERIPGVETVISLSNAEDIVATGESIKISPLIRDLPETEDEQKALKLRIDANPIYKDLIISKNADSALFDIRLDGELTNEERETAIAKMQETFSTAGEKNGYSLSGSPAGRAEMFRCVLRDFVTLCPLAMLLLIFGMYLIFRSYLCILLPYVAISLAVVWTIGSMYLIGLELNFFSVLIPTILFIVGTLDCIHILSQYQECRYTCRTKKEALEDTVRLMLFPCFFNSVTIVIGFSSAGVGGISASKEFGVFVGLGMAYAYVLAITILPIGLSVANTRTFSLKRPPSQIFEGFLGRTFELSLKYPYSVMVASVAFFIAGVYGGFRLNLETDLGKFFGKSFKGLIDTVYIEKQLGGIIPLYVLIDTGKEDAIKEPQLLERIDKLGEFLRRQAGVDKVVSASDLVKYMNYKFHESDEAQYRIPGDRGQVTDLLFMATSSDAKGLLGRFFDETFQKTAVGIRYRLRDLYSIDRFNQTVRAYLKTLFDDSGVKANVTGTAVLIANMLVPVLSSLKQSLFVAVVSISLVMVLVFRSLRLAIISMIPNILPIVITLGAMGLMRIPLNFVTAPVAAIALGLAIDDTIHFMSRFRMEFSACSDYREAIRRTLLSVGKPIVISAIILSVGFSIFIFSNFQPTRDMGLLISFSMTTALFGDLVLLPVLLIVFKPLGKERMAS